MIKRFFLRAASDPFNIGCLPFMMIFFVFVVGGAIGIVINRTWGSSLLGLSFLFVFPAAVMALLTFFVCRRYVVYALNPEDNLLLKVKDGQVVETSDRFWKEKGCQYCLVGLPEIKNGKFTIDTSFTYELEKMETTIEPSLTFYVSQAVLQNGFVPQELYDHVVTQGYRSVSEMILDHFAGAVEDTPEIRIVLEDYSLNFFRLLSAIANALNRPMPIWLLSNIQKIEVNLSKEDIYHEGEIVFPPRDVEIVCLGERNQDDLP